jgi:hypothetical protein
MLRSPWRLPLLVLLLALAAAPAGGDENARRSGPPALGGAAITAELARAVYEQLSAATGADGCRLVRFDTKRFHIDIGLQTPAGVEHSLLLGSVATSGGAVRHAGGWSLDAGDALARDCAATLAAYEKVLTSAPSPRGSMSRGGAWTALHANYRILAATLLLLAAWTAFILYREARARRPPPAAMAALLLVWLVGLGLRVWVSPHTFLHEYYHIAEALYANLEGETGPVYGDTGPALFQLAATLLGRDGDPRVIFAANAFVASLAIPAIALLDLAVTGSWARAVCAAALLCVLPQHLRFSASEVLFVPAVTLALWSAALFVRYLDSRRAGDALCAALALSAAVQTRPEMLLFPVAVAALVPLARPRAWRVLATRQTLLAIAVLALLLIPRLLELLQVFEQGTSPPASLPDWHRFSNALVLLQGDVTPGGYLPLLAAGLLGGLWWHPGLTVWAGATFLGFALFSLSLFDNGPYNVRTQVLPSSFLMLIGAGVAVPWLAAWGRHRRRGAALGAVALLVFGTTTVRGALPFITRLGDQQLEWAFLERTVPQLPDRGTLLAVVEVGGRNLDAFPEYLLRRAGKSYRTVDLRQALAGAAPWPQPGSGALFYQGMFCYFAFPDEPPPEPMAELCRAVHERYRLEPLMVEDLDIYGYSALSYAPPPYRIGFYVLAAPRSAEPAMNPIGTANRAPASRMSIPPLPRLVAARIGLGDDAVEDDRHVLHVPGGARHLRAGDQAVVAELDRHGVDRLEREPRVDTAARFGGDARVGVVTVRAAQKGPAGAGRQPLLE